MLFDYRIHNISHVIKALLGHLEYVFFKSNYDPRSLYVLNFHGTPKKFLRNFEAQIQFLKKKFQFLTPDEAISFLRGENMSLRGGPFMLITFDDNLSNNAHAIEILEKYNIRALHFVITDFLNCPKSVQRSFYQEKIRPVINASIEKNEEDLTAYTWDQMKIWIKNGHKFGVHTKSHTMVKDKLGEAELHQEMVSCKYEMAEQLGIAAEAIPFFCSINDTPTTIGKKELACIRGNYEFHFTTLAGSNTPATHKMGIRRLNIESFWMMGAVKYTLGNWNLKRWKRRLQDFDNLLIQP